LQSRDLLRDAFTRLRELVHMSATGLGQPGLTYRPEPGANSIAWLIWHLTRIKDDHVSEVAGLEQAWVTDGWAAKFWMEPVPKNGGRGHGPEQLAAISPGGPDLLIAYHDAVSDRTFAYLKTVDENELDRIIDRSYDPPVSVGVRLVILISDNIQHVGRARYLRGIVGRIL
jgi:hypothetical protein